MIRKEQQKEFQNVDFTTVGQAKTPLGDWIIFAFVFVIQQHIGGSFLVVSIQFLPNTNLVEKKPFSQFFSGRRRTEACDMQSAPCNFYDVALISADECREYVLKSELP